MAQLHRLLVGLAAWSAAALACATGLPADHGHSYTTLASFDKGEPGPRYVASSLAAHPAGHFYGISYAGGQHDAGTIFRMGADGVITVLHEFSGPDGQHPTRSPLLLARDGQLYGTTNTGGASGGGTAFRLAADGSLHLLHSFGEDAKAPREPSGGLVEGPDGELYGTTERGGDDDRGTVFRLRRGGGIQVLHAFFEGCTKGCFPRGLVDGGDGHLYGLTIVGGNRNLGTAYRIDPAGTVKLLHHFIRAEGGRPLGPLLRARDGSLFGATSTRGRHGHGTVFQMQRKGDVTVLNELNPKTGIPAPARLAEAHDGTLYLTTLDNLLGDAVLRVERSGRMTVVHRFSGREGTSPWAGLVLAADNTLVGATQLAIDHARGRFGTVYAIGLPDHAVSGTGAPAPLPAPPAPRLPIHPTAAKRMH